MNATERTAQRVPRGQVADSVRNVMASHYVRKAYRPGQRVRILGIEGEVVELTPVEVILVTGDGEARIPARQFLDNIALIIDSEEDVSA